MRKLTSKASTEIQRRVLEEESVRDDQSREKNHRVSEDRLQPGTAAQLAAESYAGGVLTATS